MTDLIIRPRQTGKTFELVHRTLDHRDGVLIVSSVQERDRLVHRYPPLRDRVFVAGVDGRWRPRDARAFIDNADDVLAKLLRMRVTAITLTGPEYDFTERREPPARIDWLGERYRR